MVRGFRPLNGLIHVSGVMAVAEAELGLGIGTEVRCSAVDGTDILHPYRAFFEIEGVGGREVSLTRDFVIVSFAFGESQIVNRGQDFEVAVWLGGVAQRVYLTPTAPF